MALSYEFSIGSVRAKENSLFTKSELEQMLACKSEAELVRYLADKGYGEGGTVDEIIENHTQRMWDYLKSIAPDFEIFNPFFYQNDVHNLKVVLKGIMSGRDYKALLLDPHTIEPDKLEDAVKNRKFGILPEWLSEPADEAYDLIAHTNDAKLSDAVIDKAVMQKMLESGKALHSEFLDCYFKTTVFYNNVKIALRASRTGTSRDYLSKALCEVDGFRMSAIIEAALRGLDALLDVLEKIYDYDCSKAIQAFKVSATEFEKFTDNKLITLVRESCKRASEGAEPIMGFYLGCLAEQKAIHIIASGIKTSCSTEIIRERLREIYG